MASFEALGVIPELISAISQPQLDWLLPTPVQDEAIPLILGGGDVMVAAETGSGKTGAFALPILQIVYEYLRGWGGTSSSATKSGSSGNKATKIPVVVLSKSDCDEMFIIKDGLVGESSANWQGGRANVGVFQGKYYFECTVRKGLGRVGWSTVAGNYQIGKDAQSFGYGGTGIKSHRGNYVEYGDKFGPGDTIGSYIDFDEGTISWSKNGKYLGVAFEFDNNDNNVYFPAGCVKDGEISFNFGRTAFRYQPGFGYQGIQSANVEHTNIFYQQQKKSHDDGGGGAPLALILAPTRDLAQQLYDDFAKFKVSLKEPTINLVLCIGGVGKMMAEIKKAHIVIGTIGSVVGLIKGGKLSLSKIKFFVIDEADRVLDDKQGNQGDVLAIYSRFPDGVQVMMFSATLHSKEIQEMSGKICKNPQWVDLKGKEYVPDTVHHCILSIDPAVDQSWTQHHKGITTDGIHSRDNIQYNIRPNERLSAETLSEGTKRLKPLILQRVIDAFKMDQCLVFCRTRDDCDNLEKFMTFIGGGQKFLGAQDSGKENPYSCCVLHSGRSQAERNQNLKLFKEGDCRFLICTDVAARGIDIKQLPFVINLIMPAEDEDYIHRVGRVGRADHPGVAISLVSPYKEKVWYHKCPSRGNNCNDVRLVEQGGCAIWYNELEIFKKVEQRLGGIKIPKLDQSKLNPKMIDDLKKTIERKDPLVVEAEKKVLALKPKVEELYQLEVECQNSYLFFQPQFENSWKYGPNR